MGFNNLDKFLNVAIETARLASVEVAKIYHSQNFTSYIKADGKEPVTTADLLANKIICNYLSQYATLPILSEENQGNASRLKAEYIWLVDPLDGTKEFLSKNSDFSINIALVVAGRPVIGVIAHPVENIIYYATKNKGAFLLKDNNKESLRMTTKQQLTNLTILVSRSHGHPALISQLNALKTCKIIAQGSALKYCAVASGKADATLRKIPLHEWDIAAADCILHEAGGMMTTLNGELFNYNTSAKTLIESGVVASNKILH